jgi:hypothetical protein
MLCEWAYTLYNCASGRPGEDTFRLWPNHGHEPYLDTTHTYGGCGLRPDFRVPQFVRPRGWGSARGFRAGSSFLVVEENIIGAIDEYQCHFVIVGMRFCIAARVEERNENNQTTVWSTLGCAAYVRSNERLVTLRLLLHFCNTLEKFRYSTSG